MEGLGAAPLQRRLFATTAVPDGQHFEPIADDTVVQPVPDALNSEATDPWLTGLADEGTHARLLQKKAQRLLQLLAHGTRSGRSVGCPPPDNPFDLARSPAGDMKLKRHRYS